MLGVVFYCFIEKYVCIDYLCLQREHTFSSLHRGVVDTSLNDLSGIGITEILLNIVSCYIFVQFENSTLILTCRSKLVSYYPSKGFLILERYSKALKNVPLRVKICINDIKNFDGYFVMSFYTPIPSVTNNLKKIYLGGSFFG